LARGDPLFLLVQFGLYVSPVGLRSAVVPEKRRLLYFLNPIVAVIEGFRWCLLRSESPIHWPGFYMHLAVTAFSLRLAIRQFRKMEKSFADLISALQPLSL
jgi:lipopolysaccharide transport system permease protein